jgi:hypothetical protein
MVKVNLHTLYKIVFFFFLFAIVSRGFFELFLEKKTAFLVQVIAISFFITVSLLFFKVKLSAKYLSIQSLIFIVFVFSAIFSSIITVYLKNGGAPFFYSGIMCFLAFVSIFISSFNINKAWKIDIGKMIVVLVLLLFGVAIYEQVTNTLMPGAWWHGTTVRPASLTGSKQHYAIVLAIITLYLFQYWLILRKKIYLIGFFLGVIGVFLSLTRSGAMILVLAFFPYICYKFYIKHLIKIKTRVLLYLAVSLFFGLVFILIYFDVQFFFDRMLSAIDTKSAGNGERVKAWLRGIDMMLTSNNILLGQYTGVVTNATRTVTNTKSFVVESGTLQMLLNFGVIGFLSFYFILFNIYSRIKKNHIFLFFVLFSFLCSTIVYQSIETIPFIVLISLIPLVSNNIKTLSVIK